MSDTRQVICMKWGTLYGSEYVNRLYAMAMLNTTSKLRFVCLTDDTTGINPGVECLSCPDINIPMPYALKPWRKIALWSSSEKLHNLTGDWLFFDLDIMITGCIDDFFTYRPEAPFVVMQNWTQRGSGIGNTSAFRFRIGCATHLYERLISDFMAVRNQYRNEQIYISHEINKVTFWPDEWCLLFKVQCVPAWPMRLWKAPVLPVTARVIAFPGYPNPIDALNGTWPEKKSWKRLYKKIRPTPWISSIWADAEEKLARNQAKVSSS